MIESENEEKNLRIESILKFWNKNYFLKYILV